MIEIIANGITYQFPEGTSDGEIAAAIDADIASQQSAQEPAAAPPPAAPDLARGGDLYSPANAGKFPEATAANTGNPSPTSLPRDLGQASGAVRAVTTAADNLIGDDDPTTFNRGEKLAAMLNAGGNGLLANYGAEVGAAADAAIGRGSYDERQAFYDRQNADLKEQHPVLGWGAEIGGAMLLPGAAIKRGAGWLINGGKAVGIGAAYGGVAATGAANGGVADRAAAIPRGMAYGAAGGAVAVPLAKVASWAVGKFGRVAGNIMRNRRYFDGSKITDEGQEALKAAGIDPATVSARFQSEFADQTQRITEPVEAARAAQMSEFGIPAYRANVSGSVDDFAAFERARNGGMNEAASARVGAAADVQMGAARRAGDDIATGLSGGKATDQFDAAVGVQEGLRTAQANSIAEARGAYQALEGMGGGIQSTAVKNLGSRIGNFLRTNNVNISRKATPNARAAIDELNGIFEGAQRGAVPFMSVEHARQRLVTLRTASNRGSLGSDQYAMAQVVDAFDSQVDEMMTSAMIQGDGAILAQAEKARGLWSRYRQTFTGDGAASRFIQKMTDEDASPDDVARWLFSAGRLGSGPFNSTLANGLKTTLGETSEAWAAIRQGAFRQLITKPEGVTQPGPQALVTSINTFLNGPTTRALSRELFNPEEIGQMRRFAGALRQMVPPKGATNPSGTAYELSRMARDTFGKLVGALGFVGSGGNVAVGMGVAGGAGAVQGISNRAAVSAMLRPTAPTAAVNAPIAAGALAMQEPGKATTEAFQDLLRQERRR